MGFVDRFAQAWLQSRDTVTPNARSFSIPNRTSTAQTRPVTTSDAMALGSVYRAVSLIAVAAAQLPWKVVTDTGEVEPNTFVRAPDPLLSRSAFVEQTTVALALNGNAFWRLGRNARNEVVTAENLNPEFVEVVVNREGRTTGFKYQGLKEYTTDEVKHLSLFRVPGRARGLSPIEAANLELRGAIDLSTYQSNWFYSGGVPTGLLSTQQDLTRTQAEEAKAWWNENASAANGIAVVGNGLSFDKIGMNASEAQIAELRKLSATEIARLFGVPASLMLADAGTSLTYSNVSQEWLGWQRFGLQKYTLEIEQAMSSLLPGFRKEVRFTYDALLRQDTLARYQAHAIALNNEPFMTREEVRALEDLPPEGAV
jgi:HK97 family phage portal protein